MSTAEKIYDKARALPPAAQQAVLHIIEELSARQVTTPKEAPLTLHEAADVRGKLAAWEEDWNAPGMEVYDRP